MTAVVELELYGRRLAQATTYDIPHPTANRRRDQIRLVDLHDGSSRTIAFTLIGENEETLLGPSFAGGALAWARDCAFDCPVGYSAAFRLRYRTGAYERAELRGPFAGFAALRRGAVYARSDALIRNDRLAWWSIDPPARGEP